MTKSVHFGQIRTVITKRLFFILMYVIMLLIHQVLASSFKARLSPMIAGPHREISLKASKEMVKTFVGQWRKKNNPPASITLVNSTTSGQKAWNPFGWISPVSASSVLPSPKHSVLGKQTTRVAERYKVITDVDDTIVSSGGIKLFGIKLGGVDNRYKRGQFYPGVIQFALELSRIGHPKSTPTTIKTKYDSGKHLPSKVAVLTARAREFKFALALKPSSKLNRRYQLFGENSGHPEWGIGDVYYGSVLEWIFHHRKGLRKFKNFEIMLRKDDAASSSSFFGTPHLSPRHKYILLGDTGEKDEEAGEHMARNYPDRVRAVFLHSVYNINIQQQQPPPRLALPKDRLVQGVPFYYFRTYIGAAVKAYEHRLLSREAVQRIAKTAIQEMKDLDQLSLQEQQQRRHRLLVQFPGISGKRREELTKQWETLQRMRWQEMRTDLSSCGFLRPFLSELPKG